MKPSTHIYIQLQTIVNALVLIPDARASQLLWVWSGGGNFMRLTTDLSLYFPWINVLSSFCPRLAVLLSGGRRLSYSMNVYSTLGGCVGFNRLVLFTLAWLVRPLQLTQSITAVKSFPTDSLLYQETVLMVYVPLNAMQNNLKYYVIKLSNKQYSTHRIQLMSSKINLSLKQLRDQI